MVYSLTHYQLTIQIPDSMKQYLSEDIKNKGLIIGGSGSYLESIEISQTTDTWTVKGDATGSYIHTMNADRTGEVTVNISQLSEASNILRNLNNTYFNKLENTKSGFINLDSFPLITLTNIKSNKVIAECKDCFIKKAVNKSIAAEASNESWIFTCGEITIKGN